MTQAWRRAHWETAAGPCGFRHKIAMPMAAVNMSKAWGNMRTDPGTHAHTHTDVQGISAQSQNTGKFLQQVVLVVPRSGGRLQIRPSMGAQGAALCCTMLRKYHSGPKTLSDPGSNTARIWSHSEFGRCRPKFGRHRSQIWPVSAELRALFAELNRARPQIGQLCRFRPKSRRTRPSLDDTFAKFGPTSTTFCQRRRNIGPTLASTIMPNLAKLGRHRRN